MMKKNARQRGFTLVETLMTLILVLVTAGIILSIFYMSTSEIRESSANMRMEKLYDIASYNIGWNVRKARAVLSTSASFSNVNSITANDSTDGIYTYDEGGNITAGFRINGSILQERDSTGSWVPFVSGDDTVRVSSDSRFSVESGGQGMTVHLILERTVNGTTYTIASRGDRFRCRNSL